MNAEIQNFARNLLKENLAKCTDKQQTFFKRMYGNMDLSIAEVIDRMPEDKLDWAIEQVDHTLRKNQNKEK